jgi:hypothetical protein
MRTFRVNETAWDRFLAMSEPSTDSIQIQICQIFCVLPENDGTGILSFPQSDRDDER